jgi:catechol 2,3-dioxygenase-like lactoylglutathione lyase family enzyme
VNGLPATAGVISIIHIRTPPIPFPNLLLLIPARDVEEAINFYRNSLGFELDYRDAMPGQFAVVGRDGAAAIVCQPGQALGRVDQLADRGRRDRCLYARYRKVGWVHPNGALGEQLWGTREFSLLDSSGVCIALVQKAGD